MSMLLYCVCVLGHLEVLVAAKKSSHSGAMIGLSLMSAVLAVLVALADRTGLVPGGLRPVLAVLPVLPPLAFFGRIARWLRSLDELERMIHLEAMVIQFGLTGILVMTYGMLARAGAVPNVLATTAFPFLWLALFAFWSVGIVWVRRKYQ